MRKKQASGPLALLILNSLWITACSDSQYNVDKCSPVNLGQTSGAVTCRTPDNTIIGAEMSAIDIKDYEYKGGVSGRILGTDYWVGATVCFDNNRNGLCDSGIEPIEYSVVNGRFSFPASVLESSIKNKAPLLAIKKSLLNKTVIALYAPAPKHAMQDNINITPFTSLVVNEMYFNPRAIGSAELSRIALLEGHLAFADVDVLLGHDYLAEGEVLVSDLANAIGVSLAQAHSMAIGSHYKATAATVDKMYQKNSYDVMVSRDEIANQFFLDVNFKGELSPISSEWRLDHDEEMSVDVDVKYNLAVIGSQYHNRLIVLDLAGDKPQERSLNLFAGSPLERDVKIDATTGASEQVLDQVKITPDMDSVLVSVKKYDEDSSPVGVGLYRADFSDPDYIPNVLFAGDVTVANNKNYFHFAELNTFSLSRDGSVIALSGDDKQVVILNEDDMSIENTFMLNEQTRSVLLNHDGSTAYIGLLGRRRGLSIWDVNLAQEVDL